MKQNKFGKILLLAVMLIGFGLSCADKTPVNIVNYNDSEYYETIKDGEKFQCMSEYYVKEVMQAKINSIKPK